MVTWSLFISFGLTQHKVAFYSSLLILKVELTTINILRLGNYIKRLDEGAFGIFGKGLVAYDLASIVDHHKSIRGDHIPTCQIHLETRTESVLVNKAHLNFWRATSKGDKTTDAELEEGEGPFMSSAHDEDAIRMKDSVESLVC
mmetsp:Transcript_2710/g.4619  ORF Transcript_2710/g.4619 Transcript_2710/m.4619 type:complete len:144 (-) Transcript_2710:345-776(-)